MPIIKSAIKRAKQTLKRRDRNVDVKKALRGAIKAFTAKPTAENLSKAQSELDKAVKKNILEKNTAARRKAKLAKVAKTAGVSLAGTAKTAKTPAKKAVATKKTAEKPVAAKKVAEKKAPAKKAAPAKKPAAKKVA